MKKLLTLLVALLITGFTYGQGSVMGKVVDNSGDPLIGASVYLEGTSTGTITDVDGNFAIKNVDNGSVNLVVSYVGFKTKTVAVNVSGKTNVGTITLESDAVMLSAIEVVADYAVERKTPVAFVKLDKKEIEKVLGSRDIPLMLNTTPSVYATEQGGGAGDARINVRGFNQRNVAIMINGVPVNDMENGWVYWSNWDGVADATSSIQLQRGLSAVNLATPSIGGTMNIITSPAEKKLGGVAKMEYGSGNFLKSTITAHSGMINDKFAMSMSLVRKVGDGIIDKTWTDAWAYYLGASLKLNNKHKLEFFALGAPQRHGQNLYKQNIATYSHDFAESIDYNTEAFKKFPEAGRNFNQNWAPVSGYNEDQYWNGKTHARKADDFINTRENFYHKPQVNLNWYADWNEKVSQYTVFYYSGGTGGGTGTYGSLYRRDAEGNLGDDDYKFYYGPNPWTWDLNETVSMNKGPAGDYYVDKKAKTKEDGQSIGILRNSRNNQNTIGAISKFKINWSNNLKSSIGLDWRTAKIDHFREVRDLLGGSYFVDTKDEFASSNQKVLGDKIAYNFTNTVDWLGAYFQTEYTMGDFSTYAMAGWSTIKYTYFNNFVKDDSDKGKDGHLYAETGWINGLQVKGGANYILNDNMNVFGNLGYVSKVPIFDAVINDRDGTKADDPKNEKFYAFEAGYNVFSTDNKLRAKLSGYYTLWKDRTRNIGIYNQDGTEGYVFVTGMNQLHKGIELDVKYNPINMLELGFGASVADWRYINDVEGQYKTWDPVEGNEKEGTYTFYAKDLKVGDAPQTQFVFSTAFKPTDGLFLQVLAKHYRDYYAEWDPFSRTEKEEDAEGNRIQSWKTPSYNLLDFHASYNLPLSGKLGVQIFAHVFNVLDEVYIQDATDNSKYNGYTIKNSEGDVINDHTAERAEVFFGLPRRFNVGAKVTF